MHCRLAGEARVDNGPDAVGCDDLERCRMRLIRGTPQVELDNGRFRILPRVAAVIVLGVEAVGDALAAKLVQTGIDEVVRPVTGQSPKAVVFGRTPVRAETIDADRAIASRCRQMDE